MPTIPTKCETALKNAPVSALALQLRELALRDAPGNAAASERRRNLDDVWGAEYNSTAQEQYLARSSVQNPENN